MFLKRFTPLFFSLLITVPALAAEREWNFLVFINGVNNLDDFGSLNINQMEEVGSTDTFNILVQWGSLATPSVRRLQVIKDSDVTKVTSPVLQDIGRTDMGDPNQLVDFARWAQANYPAKRTMVVVWNHGNGWHFVRKKRSTISPMDISYDDRTGNSIDTVELGQAMRDIAKVLGKKVDIYASDACLMAMIEVADEMSDSVNYFMGSQDYEPGEGWSYATLLSRLNMGGPGMSSAWVAQQASKDFLAAYSDGGTYGEMPVAMSAFDLSQIGPMKDAIKQIKSQLIQLSDQELKKVGEDTTDSKAFTADYLDLSDFLTKVAMNKLSTKAASDYQAAFGNFVIANDQNIDDVTTGMSIWLPSRTFYTDMYMKDYKKLAFDRAVGWSEFLMKIVQ